MPALFDQIRGAVRAERYLFTNHADDMLRERRIMAWQIIAGVEQARLIVERPGGEPNPVVELEQLLADGTAIKAVWAYLRSTDRALLVTVHFFDR